MKLTENMLKNMIRRVMNKSPEVPQEAKEKLFAKMMAQGSVPEGGTIDDAEFWEIQPGDYGFDFAVEVDGKHYYGEI